MRWSDDFNLEIEIPKLKSTRDNAIHLLSSPDAARAAFLHSA
ncbi:propionate catabolism operon regulatory PrpR domain protein [Burkholderia thailandensis]|uniref:Propionate catabolism operon regulatory PrpR domain protein n=1 Tax=Burkholderia thailandensis TaxID=57975 RepID=A0AAW9CL80_BURTH|nr:propionate catabolism operon regulatory PrpR domain protein [Burkholderia thailandensis]MDW9251369.1 propionate catabolism operon regulatory PrpR domain protein [Burkholderia thailandensis]